MLAALRPASSVLAELVGRLGAVELLPQGCAAFRRSLTFEMFSHPFVLEPLAERPPPCLA